MKIVNLCGPNPLDPIESGGVGVVVYNLNKRLVKHGFDITNICYSERSFIKKSNIGTVIGLKVPHNELLKILIYSLRAAYLSQKFNPDLIQSEGSSSLGAGIAARFFNKGNVKIIERAHGTHIGLIDSLPNKNLHMKILGKLYAKIIENLTFQNADTIVAVSKLAKHEIMNYYRVAGYKIKVINPAVNTKYYVPPSNKSALRKKLNLNASDRYVLFVGLDAYRKGLDIVIDSILSIKDTKIKLLVIGVNATNFYKEFPKERLNGRVIILGKPPNKVKRLYYQASDIFVFPSRHEGFAVTPLEAMASGLPTVVSKTSGTNEIITDGVNGMVLKDNSAQPLTNTIIAILGNHKIMDRMSKASRELVLRYGWDAVAKIYYDLYYNLYTEHRGLYR